MHSQKCVAQSKKATFSVYYPLGAERCIQGLQCLYKIKTNFTDMQSAT